MNIEKSFREEQMIGRGPCLLSKVSRVPHFLE